MLATADEAAVAKTLAPAIAQQMRSRSSAGKQSMGTSAATAANYAAAGMAARAATTLVQSAREHLRRQMRELAALAADIAEDEEAEAAVQAAAEALVQPGGAAAGAKAAAPDGLSADEVAQIQRQVAQLAGGQPGTPDKPVGEVTIAPAAALRWTQGVVRCARVLLLVLGWVPVAAGQCHPRPNHTLPLGGRVVELRPRSTPMQLEEFFAEWAAQPRCALALHCLSDEELAAAATAAASVASTAKLPPPPGQSGGAALGPAGEAGAAAAPRRRLQGLAVCWSLQEAFFLELSGESRGNLRVLGGKSSGGIEMHQCLPDLH